MGQIRATSESTRTSAAGGRDWLRIVLIELAGLLAVAFIWLLWQMVVPTSHTVVLFLLGSALAFVLADPSNWMAQRLGIKRALAILITYLIVFVVVIGGLLLLAVPFARQATELVDALPGRMTQIQGSIAELQTELQGKGIQLDLDSIRSQAANSMVGSADVVLGGLIGEAAAIGGALTDAIMVLVISVYLWSWSSRCICSPGDRPCTRARCASCRSATAAQTSLFGPAPPA
jgi:predicted PurR-regulated permease PerM